MHCCQSLGFSFCHGNLPPALLLPILEMKRKLRAADGEDGGEMAFCASLGAVGPAQLGHPWGIGMRSVGWKVPVCGGHTKAAPELLEPGNGD